MRDYSGKGPLSLVRQGREHPFPAPDAVRHSPRIHKKVNDAVHLSAHAELLSIGRTSSSAHFGVEIYLESFDFGARTIGRFSINVSSIDSARHYIGAGYGES
jgi:hypothetical protein